MYQIPFTQYLRPNGVQKKVTFETPDELLYQLSVQLLEKGVKFEIEVLRTGEISMTSELPGENSPIVHQVCKNGYEVVASVSNLITKTAERLDKREKEND